MKSDLHRALVGVLAAGLLSLPALTIADPPKKSPKKPPAKPAKPAAPAKKAGDAKAGKDAFAKEGCAGCHKAKDFKENGGELGPDLSAIGKDHPAAKIKAYIAKPKAGSMMPAYKGPAATLEDLTAYLVANK